MVSFRGRGSGDCKVMKSVKPSDRLGAIASFVLAICCLVAAGYHVNLLLPLLKDGVRTEAIVTEIHTGAKGGKWGVYEFETKTGSHVKARDKIQMYIKRLHKGDAITVIYNPSHPDIVTADLGYWIWQGPIIFFLGFILLAVLGLLIISPNRDK